MLSRKHSRERRVGRILRHGAAGVCFLLLAGCCCFGGREKKKKVEPPPEAPSGAVVYVAPVSSSIQRVAVMPFQASTELIGTSVSDLFVTELLRTGRYQLVERSQLSSVLSESEVALSGLTETRAIELGNMLGADGVIIGSVDEYGTIALKGKTLAVVGFSVRLIDCTSGRVMWSASLADSAKEAQTPLSGHARAVVRGVVIALNQQWKVQRFAPRSTVSAAREHPDAPVSRSTTAHAPVKAVESPPPVPNFTVTDLGLREISLQWKDPGIARLHYRIERSVEPGGPFKSVALLPASRESYTDRGDRQAPIQDASTYYYRVIAVSASGLESAPGSVRESMTAPPPPPVSRLAARSGEVRCVPLTWEPSADKDVVRYELYRAPAENGPYAKVGTVEPRTQTTYLDGGGDPGKLADATTYFYRIRAINRVSAESVDSDTVRATTRDLPPVVEGLTVVSGQPRHVPLAWNPSLDEKVVAYEIERSPDGKRFASIAKKEGRELTRHEDRGALADGATYQYRVRAINTAGAGSAWCPPMAATTKLAPGVPTGLKASEGHAGTIDLQWEPHKAKDIATYIITSSSTANGSWQEAGRVTAGTQNPPRFGEEDLSPGLTRYYRVRARDQDGLESAWSDPVRGITKASPDAPTNLHAEWVDGSAHLVWTPPTQTDIVAYRVMEQKWLGRGAAWRTEEPERFLSAKEVGKRLTVVVVAIDADGLESEESTPLKIHPML